MQTEVKPLRSRVSRVIAARLGALAMLAPATFFPACGTADPAGSRGEPAESESEALLAASADCAAIAAQLKAAEQLADELLAEYQDAPPGPEKSRLLQLWKAARARVAQLRAQLSRCQNPPPPLPDLVAVSVLIAPHADGTAIDAALLVRNDGQGAASGPFNIVFGSTAGGVYREANWLVTGTIPPATSYTSDYMRNIATIRDSNGVATYRFDAIVDSNHVIAESNEGNNALTVIVQDPPYQPPPPPPPPPCNGICCEYDSNQACTRCISPDQSCP